MLRISRLADYGVVIATRLAALGPDELRSGRRLAVRTGIPQPTVRKILKILGRAGIVDSTRGARGGYRLARDPAETSVADVIAALEGPIGVTECGTDDDLDCQLSGRCDLQSNWQLINEAIANALGGISLAEMSRPGVNEVLVQLRRRAPERGGDVTTTHSARQSARTQPEVKP